MRVNLSNATKHKEPHKDEYPRGRRGRGTSAQWTGGTRSLSPERWTTKRTVLRGAWGSRVGSETELAERRVQMRVVADAAHTVSSFLSCQRVGHRACDFVPEQVPTTAASKIIVSMQSAMLSWSLRPVVMFCDMYCVVLFAWTP